MVRRISPLPVRFTRAGTGRYRVNRPPLPVDGPRRLVVTIRTSEIDETNVRVPLWIR